MIEENKFYLEKIFPILIKKLCCYLNLQSKRPLIVDYGLNMISKALKVGLGNVNYIRKIIKISFFSIFFSIQLSSWLERIEKN